MPRTSTDFPYFCSECKPAAQELLKPLLTLQMLPDFMVSCKLRVCLTSTTVTKLFTALYGGTNLVFRIPTENW